MSYKFVVILFIFLLNTPKLFLTAAKPDYEENIQLELNIDALMNCHVMVTFSFNGLSRPLNFYYFQREPSFLGLSINTRYFAGEEFTSVSIDLDGKVSGNRGKFMADMMVYELEGAFGISRLSYGVPSSPLVTGVLNFAYETNFPATELRNIFLDSLPSQGFARVLTSMLLNSQNYSMLINLGNEGGWSVKWMCDSGTEKLVLYQEQFISLKEITRYSGSIASASISSFSALRTYIIAQIGSEYDLETTVVSPVQMLETREVNGMLTEYSNFFDVTGSSVEDLSIILKIVSSGIVATILIVLAQITTVIISIILIKRYKR